MDLWVGEEQFRIIFRKCKNFQEWAGKSQEGPESMDYAKSEKTDFKVSNKIG